MTQWLVNDQSMSVIESAQIDIVIDAASREIDEYCNRRFYLDAAATARVYTAQHWTYTFTDDIGSTASIVVATDENGDGTFERTWNATDYQLEPANAVVRGRPATGLRATGPKFFPVFENAGVWVGVQGGNRSFYAPGAILPGFSIGQQLVQVTAYWGWPAVPASIKNATLIQGAMLYVTKKAPAGITGSVDLGTMRLPGGLHPQAKLLVEPYRLNAGGLIP